VPSTLPAYAASRQTTGKLASASALNSYIAASAKGGVIEQCSHWVFEEKTDFIVQELRGFWEDMQRTQVEDKPVLA
jgi:pimeloyl-ACP methyl ester carboxylesterase